jgi:hypothetical protein
MAPARPVAPPTPVEQAPAGDVTIGLTPALLSSVASSGIVPTGATPGAGPVVDPPSVAVGSVVPDAVVPTQDEAGDAPVVLVAAPAPSKVEPLTPPAETPEPLQGSVLAVGPSGIGLTPPGKSSVAPSGMPDAPTGDIAPGTPSGEVAPIAGDVSPRGAICAELGPALKSNATDPAARILSASVHGAGLQTPAACGFARVGTCKRRIDISVFSGGTGQRRCRENTCAGMRSH